MSGRNGLKGAGARISAVFVKELIQMRRDRLTFAMMLTIPILQLVLFGYAINTDPKELRTAVLAEEQTPIVRSILSALDQSDYYKYVQKAHDPTKAHELLASGDVSFVVVIPAGFTSDLIRGERPQLLIEADASDPAAASNAVARLPGILESALRRDLKGPLAHLAAQPPPVEIVVHNNYNPEGITQYNIVPGLLGVIITMTCVMITAAAMTREAERGTMENLLAMPARPHEVMIGKITPYIFVGGAQTLIILLAARYVFHVPFAGSFALLVLGIMLFILANLALGFTFSTIAKTQMQAMQMTLFFFLPSMLLSGFMFPFYGMPYWARVLGEGLPLTHFLRLVRGIMLKGSGFGEIQTEIGAILVFTVIMMGIAITRYRQTLD